MKKVVRLSILIALILSLCGCAVVEDLLEELSLKKKDKKKDKEEDTVSYKKPEVFCTYFHYFKAGPKSYDQWWIQGKDPRKIAGPEEWRRDIWVGRAGDYPYVGIYNNVDDEEIMRWHIRLAKAAGISSFLLYVNDWKQERSQTDLLLNVAEQENFKIGFIEHHSFLGARSIQMLDGRPQPILPHKYVGYSQIMEQHSRQIGLPLPQASSKYRKVVSRELRNVPADAINRAVDRISGMLKRWKSHSAYLRIDGKPIIVIPYMVEELTAGEFKQLVDAVKANVGEDLYVVAIVANVYWYFAPEAVVGTGITQEWADTGVNSFTHWTPNGMVTASQKIRLKATKFNVKDSSKWGKDAMIPLMPGFEDDAWRPGDSPAPTSPRNNGKAWDDQLDAALVAKPRFLFIQGWNEWHEGAQIEPSTYYSEPYLYLRILAQKLDTPWQTPPLPPQSHVDSRRAKFLAY